MKKLNFKVLVLLVIYLLVSATSLFFTPPYTNFRKQQSSVRQKIEHFVHFQRISRTVVSESEHSIHRFLQNAAMIFTVLLFSTILLNKRRLFTLWIGRFFPNRHYSYLDYCVIRI